MKKILTLMAAALLIGCSSDDNYDEPVQPVENTDGKTLVVYFNGPMPDGIDASTGATPVVNGMSATQFVAQQIADHTGADMHHITVADGYYPVVYEELADFARSERDAGTHPALTSRLENIADYKNIFIGTPVWWYTVPMPIYSFLDTYDLTGKNVMLFTTHEGSGLADAVSVVQAQEPGANVSTSGFHTRGNQAGSQASTIANWLDGLGFTK
ncbi:MAG: NAD(P)H-dependent oxidoreductase [Bacteroidaceae bacterium]|nr:NAD(P)H-dependent oxidoreductase [Bacteroidaceae bacterium]